MKRNYSNWLYLLFPLEIRIRVFYNSCRKEEEKRVYRLECIQVYNFMYRKKIEEQENSRYYISPIFHREDTFIWKIKTILSRWKKERERERDVVKGRKTKKWRDRNRRWKSTPRKTPSVSDRREIMMNKNRLSGWKWDYNDKRIRKNELFFHPLHCLFGPWMGRRKTTNTHTLNMLLSRNKILRLGFGESSN